MYAGVHCIQVFNFTGSTVLRTLLLKSQEVTNDQKSQREFLHQKYPLNFLSQEEPVLIASTAIFHKINASMQHREALENKSVLIMQKMS